MTRSYILCIWTEAGCGQSLGLARFALPCTFFTNALYEMPFPTAEFFGASAEQFYGSLDVIRFVFVVGQRDVAMIIDLFATSAFSQYCLQALCGMPPQPSRKEHCHQHASHQDHETWIAHTPLVHAFGMDVGRAWIGLP